MRKQAGRVVRQLRRLLGGAAATVGVAPTAASAPANTATRPLSAVERYLAGGRVPWSDGYSKYKNQLLGPVLADDAQLNRFQRGERLPDGYGPRIDERMVEYPWALSRLRTPAGRTPEGPIFDAGSTFSADLVLDLPYIRGRDIVIYTFETDVVVRRPGVRFVYGDLRTVSFADETFPVIVCISTLEHVGMGQSFSYSAERPYPDARPEDAIVALREFRRVLQPGGRLLLTIPYGQREDHGWLQQFDADGIRELIAGFGGEVRAETYYRYTADGWQVASAEACADARYYNVHATPATDPDGAAAARAVCCLELIRP